MNCGKEMKTTETEMTETKTRPLTSKMKFTEPIDIHKMEIILTNFDRLFKDGLLTQRDMSGFSIADKKTCFSILYDFYIAHKKDNAFFKYTTPKTTGMKDGRIFSQNSLQSITRRVRHTIASETMVDIDMVNAHPTLLIRLCDEHDLPCPCLKHYHSLRQEWIDFLRPFTDDPKKLILSIINGGFTGKSYGVDLVDRLILEMDAIHSKVISLYPHLFKMAKKMKGDTGNVKGTTLNYRLCQMERQCLEQILDFLIGSDIQVHVLCHDGLMIEKRPHFDYDELCVRLSEHIGLSVKVKPMAEALDLSAFDPHKILITPPFKEYPDFVNDFLFQEILHGISTSKKISRLFFMLNPDNTRHFRFCTLSAKDQRWYYWSPTDGHWYWLDGYSFFENQLYEQMYPFLENHIIHLSKDGEKKSLVKSLLSTLGTITEAPSRIIHCSQLDLTDNRMPDKIDSIPYLFAFDNGVYDFQKNVFRPIVPEDYISKSCGYSYHDDYDPLKMERLKSIIRAMFLDGEDYHYLLTIIASCLVGGNPERSFFLITGTGANGKSLMENLKEATFGDYFVKIDINELTADNKKNNGTSGLSLARNCRILSTAETGEGHVLQAHIVKRATGTETITTRLLYQNPETWLPTFVPFLSTNSDPDVSKVDEALISRLRKLEHPCKFFYDDTDPDFDPLNPRHKVGRDNGLMEGIKDFKLEFFHLLKDYYYNFVKDKKIIQPPNSVISTRSYFEDNVDPLLSFLQEKFEFLEKNDDPTEGVSADVLLSIVKEDDRSMTRQKLAKKMKEFEHLGYSLSKEVRATRKRHYNIRPISTANPQCDEEEDD